VQKEINERDSLRNELDKLERQFKEKLSTIDQRMNEGDKLNLIINSL
jgi:hypothetical protein